MAGAGDRVAGGLAARIVAGGVARNDRLRVDIAAPWQGGLVANEGAVAEIGILQCGALGVALALADGEPTGAGPCDAPIVGRTRVAVVALVASDARGNRTGAVVAGQTQVRDGVDLGHIDAGLTVFVGRSGAADDDEACSEQGRMVRF